jgi:hypothetical protein
MKLKRRTEHSVEVLKLKRRTEQSVEVSKLKSKLKLRTEDFDIAQHSLSRC